MKRTIEATHLTKRFGNFVSVDRVSLVVHEGEVFGFLGPNGAGKTTTIRMLCGIIRPTSGSAKVSDYDVLREPEKVKKIIGYMSQRFTLYPDLTVKENLHFYGSIYGLRGSELRARVQEVARTLGLSGLEGRLARDLAGGFRQRLALACATLHRPKVVFLDEPTSGVDPVARRAFWDLIYGLAREGTTVFVTTHYLDEAEYCERLAFIIGGKILAEGSPEEVKRAMAGYCVFEVEGASQEEALLAIREAPHVVSVTPFGLSLHVVVEGGLERGKELMERLSFGPGHIQVRPVPPTLEDVFIYLVRKIGGNGGFVRGEV